MIDPIFKVEIEEGSGYILGKTTYSIDSLREWFLVKREFVNPMTNLAIRGIELGRLVDKMKEMDYFPKVDIGKTVCYRVYCIFEKYNNYKKMRQVIEEKKKDLRDKIREKEERMVKSGKRKNGEKMVERYMEQINRLNDRLGNLEVKGEVMNRKFMDNVNFLLSSFRKVVNVV